MFTWSNTCPLNKPESLIWGLQQIFLLRNCIRFSAAQRVINQYERRSLLKDKITRFVTYRRVRIFFINTIQLKIIIIWTWAWHALENKYNKTDSFENYLILTTLQILQYPICAHWPQSHPPSTQCRRASLTWEGACTFLPLSIRNFNKILIK